MPEVEFQWTQDSWDQEDEGVAPRPSSRRHKLAWFGVIALAIVAFEVTADPALTTVLGCLKFGWEEVRLARWLKRTDPDRGRGRICSRFYLAFGLWRVSLVATVVALAVAYVAVNLEEFGKPPLAAETAPGFAEAFQLAIVGFLLSSVVSGLAAISAARHKLKVWVGPEARWAMEQKTWPPRTDDNRRVTSNWANPVVLSAIITYTIVGLVLVFIAVSSLIPKNFDASSLGLGLMMVFMIGAPIIILVLKERVEKRMIAASAESCWSYHVSGSQPDQ